MDARLAEARPNFFQFLSSRRRRTLLPQLPRKVIRLKNFVVAGLIHGIFEQFLYRILKNVFIAFFLLL